MAQEPAIVEEGASKFTNLDKEGAAIRGMSSTIRSIKTKGTKIAPIIDKSLAMDAEIKELNSFLVSFDLDRLGSQDPSIIQRWGR